MPDPLSITASTIAILGTIKGTKKGDKSRRHALWHNHAASRCSSHLAPGALPESSTHMHLDDARIWEAVASAAGSLEEYAMCFLSMQLCFTKGLGTPIGSIVAGNSAFIKRALWMRKMLEGGLRAGWRHRGTCSGSSGTGFSWGAS